MEIEYIQLTKINEPDDPARLNIDQGPMQELIDSIRDRGLLQPILLKRSGDTFEIEAGHRRFLALSQLGWDSAPCIVLSDSTPNDEHIDRAHENLIRENISVIEEAKLVNSLVNENGRGVEETALLIKRSVYWVESHLELLDYPDDLIAALSANTITLAVARELSKCKNTEYRLSLLAYVVDTGAKSTTVKKWVNDSTLEDFTEALEQSKATGIIQQIDLGPTFMECGICVDRFSMEQLRHIFLCPTCLEGIKSIREQCAKDEAMAPDKE